MAGQAAFIGVTAIGAALAASSLHSDSTPDVYSMAKFYAQGKSHAVTAMDPDDPYVGQVGKGKAQFYSVNLGTYHCQTGVVFICRSYDMSAFRLFVFDENGAEIADQTSYKLPNQYTQAQFAFLPFPRLQYVEGTQSAPGHPVVFGALDIFKVQDKLKPGRYLLAVYGNNWMEPTPFRLKWSVGPSGPDKTSLCNAIKQAEAKVKRKREYMTDVEQRYSKAKLTYERIMEELKVEQGMINKLLNERGNAYGNFIRAAEANRCQTYAPYYGDAPPSYDSDSDGDFR